MLSAYGQIWRVWRSCSCRIGIGIILVRYSFCYHGVVGLVCAKWVNAGGLQRAIEMITDAKKKAGGNSSATIVDLHPDRPDYRGMAIGNNIISLQADPSFEELEAAGGVVQKHADAHTVLDDLFFISGEIPRRTGYEHGLKGGMRFDAEEKDWFSDEGIADERFLMCRLNGMLSDSIHI